MLKACVYTDSSKNAQNRQKMAKIGTLSLVRRVPGFSVFSAVRFLKRLKRENNFAVWPTFLPLRYVYTVFCKIKCRKFWEAKGLERTFAADCKSLIPRGL